jgi:hypothetical protein
VRCVAPVAAGLNDFLGGLGLGMLADQLKDLDLGELMDTPPPGVDEAIAISKVSDSTVYVASMRCWACLISGMQLHLELCVWPPCIAASTLQQR